MIKAVDVNALLAMPVRDLIEATLLEPEGPAFWLMVGIAISGTPDKYRPLREMLLKAGRAWQEDRVRELLRELDAVLEALGGLDEDQVH